MRYTDIEQVRAAFEAHQLSPLDAIAHARALIAPGHIEPVIDGLPAAVRRRFIAVAKGWFTQEQVTVGRGPALPAPSAQAMAELRAWLLKRGYLAEDRSAMGTVVPARPRPRNPGLTERYPLTWHTA